jgi:thioredoxin-like negative regulator of GroEL
LLRILFSDAAWSDVCAKLEPELEKVAKKLAEENPALRIGKVNAMAEKELADRLNIRGYPHLTFYGRGRPIEYRGSYSFLHEVVMREVWHM